ncbi:MAG: glycoside hydrolase family 3 C-terminal domain-containing protein [Bacteroides sp.]|nr:glycoside hydrolase family 3 C-terminal domain-containing protein [Bacteroides sp.]
MKKNSILSWALAGVLLASCSTTPNVEPAIPVDEQIEAKVEALLKKMTLEEKVGQMCQLNIDVLQDRTANPMQGFTLSEALLDTVIGKYKVGSILNVPNGMAQNTAKWQEIITRIQEKSMEELGIPCLYGVDQIHGATYTAGATFFPQGINMAATFNRELTREGARISAYETKAGSIPWTFAPVLDLARDARWPRHWENYGEDAYVNAEMGREAVLGFQGENPNQIGENSIAACLKHYMGYGVPVSGKDRTPSSITEQDMRERHFAPFLETVKAGALSVMVNSAMNNGLPFHANYELLTQWLKEDLNWDGMIVTDWADINNLCTRDHIAATKKEAIMLGINAGIDMSMVPYEWSFCTDLKELVEEGKVSMERIDDAVRRILRLKLRLNLFEKPYYNLEDYPQFACQEHADAALQAAEESMVLLKNNNSLLPIAKGKKVLLTGPNANSMRTLNGGWSYTWQGSNADHLSKQYNTILEALQNKLGAANVVYEPGVTYNDRGQWWQENEPQIQKAVAAARGVDYIIACIGENSYCETPGNLDDLTLSANQLELVKALAKTGKPIIMVLNEGRPRIVKDIEPLATAVVHVMLPGNYGGDAFANLLVGDANFSGKLPFTYPKHVNSLITYDYKPCEHIGEQMAGAYNYDAQVSVQWMFGYGLSYTTFAYSNLKVDKSNFSAADELTFTVDVTNTGNVAGKESVLLFSSDLVASLTPDIRRLRAFDKVALQPGETKTVTLKVPASDLAFVGYDGKWILEAGDFRIQVGNQTVDVACNETKKWETPNK